MKRVSIFIALLATTFMVHAQATPTASRWGDLQIGAGYSFAHSDYSPDLYHGFGIYTDFDFTRHLGVEAEFHFNKSSSPAQYYEKTYEIGGRYFRTYGRVSPYAKIMIGRGVFNYANNSANLAYNMAAGGGGADIRIKRYLNFRGDVEYQYWSGFENNLGQANGLTPFVTTIGLAYHFR